MAGGVDTENQDGLIGRIIAGKLRIIELLGTGSMGRVYRAHHMSLEKDVAIKVLRSAVASDPTRSFRFAREARAASRLNHPNSVAILDFGEDGDDKLLYIAMELLDGVDLQTVIDEGSLRIERICHIMIQALAALAAAHDAGIIHRDVKPSNIVLVKQKNDEGQLTEVVKVCDFGVAKLYNAKNDTHEGNRGPQRVIGTPLYMSPEQALGEKLDPRTDVYSCGVIMYEMLTGEPPFSAETPMGVLMKHVSDPVRPPSELISHVNEELEALILWSLEKDQMLRPSTARELRNGLRAFLAGKAGTIPALSRYGITQLADEGPWSGPTPYYQLDIPPPPRANSQEALQPRLAVPQGTDYGLTSTPHQALVEDLALLPASSFEGSYPSSALQSITSEQPENSFVTRPTQLKHSITHRHAPPRGVHVPWEVRQAETNHVSSVSYNQESPSPPKNRDTFSRPSFFHAREYLPEAETLDEEIPIESPPPRPIQTNDEPGPIESPSAPRIVTNMLHYLWKRYGLAPNRSIPSKGFWVRDSNGQDLGPLTWSEVTHVLRMEATEGDAEESSVSADRLNWIAAPRFVRLAGIEAIFTDNQSIPAHARYQGSLDERSVTSLFGFISHREATGRLTLKVELDRRNAYFEIHVDEGRPTFVFTNEPHLQLPNLLISKGLLVEERLPLYIQTVLQTAITLEQAVRQDVQFDVNEYRNAVMKERLRHLLRWRQGFFAFDENSRPARHRPFAPSLLALLPDLVYRTLSDEDLEREFASMKHLPGTRALEATERLQDMGLTRSQRGVAERLLAANRLDDVIPSKGDKRKAYTTMAYVLRETGLLQA
ncbi:MAG: protein kinase [Myxococcales bacterium]|nr:protein kinase [Myxococcales bacterium]